LIRLLISLFLILCGTAVFLPAETENYSYFVKPSGLFVLEALVQAYPDKVSGLKFRDNDWSVLINNRVFYWSSGRMLTEDTAAAQNTGNFLPYNFEPYGCIKTGRKLSASEIKEINDYIDSAENGEKFRSPDFFNALWGMETYYIAEHTVVNTTFLGFKIRIHPEIKPVLEQIEKEIIKQSESNAEIEKWIKSLKYAGGYNWRNIAGSGSRSSHSYGTAVDLVPYSYGGKQVYWRWAKEFNPAWWNISGQERYRIPEKVVKIFESYGFIWGGKWLFFDQIHFEYRPELIILGNYYGN